MEREREGDLLLCEGYGSVEGVIVGHESEDHAFDGWGFGEDGGVGAHEGFDVFGVGFDGGEEGGEGGEREALDSRGAASEEF